MNEVWETEPGKGVSLGAFRKATADLHMDEEDCGSVGRVFGPAQASFRAFMESTAI